jgi:hypothetical protein
MLFHPSAYEGNNHHTLWGVGETHPDISCQVVAPDIKQNATSGRLMLSFVNNDNKKI